MFKRLFLLSVLVGAAALSGPARAQSSPDLVSPGKLTYGTAATFAPFEYQKDGAFTGFDIDFGNTLAKKMGLVPLHRDYDGLADRSAEAGAG